MSNSFDWKRDPRKAIEKGKKLSLSPLNKEGKVEFTIIEEVGRGGSVITYKAKILHNNIEEICYLKELYPFRSCIKHNILRQPDGVSLGIGFGIDDNTSENNFSFINSEEWESLKEDYEKIKKLRSIDKAPLFICDVYEKYHNDYTYYMQVPFESDKTLSDYIENDLAKKKDIPTILRLGKELAIMTRQLHENETKGEKDGYLHLDIKPENLLYKSISNDSAKTLSFLDMGSVVRKAELGNLGYLPSSHGYSSPEQEHRHIIDANCPETTDIFSIGAVIFKMLTGKEPSETDTKRKIFSFDKTDPMYVGYGDEFFDKLNTLLCKALSFSPSFRFPCCDDLVKHLDSMISETPFDKAFNKTRGYLGKKSNDALFMWRGENFEEELFTKVEVNGERYNSVYELICDKPDKKKFWLCGQGGCGKSAHLKRLAYDLLVCKEKEFAPIYIDSEKISEFANNPDYDGKFLKKAICDELQIFPNKDNLDVTFDKTVRPYNFIIIFDGLNETEKKESILSQINEICDNENSKPIFVVSDRNDAPADYLKVTIQPLGSDNIQKYLSSVHKIDVESEKLCDMLSQNLFLLNIFCREETDEKKYDFSTEADLLLVYTNGIISKILKSLHDQNRNKSDTDIAIAFYEKLEFAVFHSIDKNTLSLTVPSDGDGIKGIASAIENCRFINRITNSITKKFEHESIRDFLAAYILWTRTDLKNTDLLKDRLLPRETLRYLGELASEGKLKDNEELTKYNKWLDESVESRKKGEESVKSNKESRKITAALLELEAGGLDGMYTRSAINLVTAILLGRGYDSFELLEQNSPNLVGYLLNLEDTDNNTLEKAENKYVFRFADYIGKEANKRREEQRTEWERRQKKDKIFFGFAKAVLAVLAAITVCVILNIIFPHVEIESTTPVVEGVWVADETWFHTGFNARSIVKFYSYSDSKWITSKNVSSDDFIMEGFTADISIEVSGNDHLITLNNVKPSDQTPKVTECRLILKRGIIGSSSGITSRKNKETEICRFNIFPDKDYKIDSYINMDATKIKTGNTLDFVFGFNSHKPFESDISAEDIILENFSADVNIVLDETVIESVSLYNRAYHVTLRNIQPTGDGEKSIYIPSGVAHNEYGILSYGLSSNAFEISDKAEYFPSPEVTCELFYDDTVSPGASLLMTVDFSVYDSATYDTNFSTDFTTDSEESQNLPFFSLGFSFDKESVYISDVANNAHKYWVLLSDVYPDKDADEYKIYINDRIAITQNGTSNEIKEFTFDIPFSDVITDSTPPEISVEQYHKNINQKGYYYTNPTFILTVTDDSILPYLSPESIKSGIRVLNADCGNVVVKNNGGWTDKSREYKITLYDVAPKSSYENIILQFVPGAVTDSAGNLSEELRANVFEEETMHFYCNLQNAVLSPDAVNFDCKEVGVYDGITDSFAATYSDSYVTDFRMEGFKANVVKVNTNGNKRKIELINVEFDEGVDSGTLTLYAISPERTIYKASITVKKTDTN